MSRKPSYSQKILKILAQKPAISVKSIKEDKSSKENYALARSVKSLIDSGCIEVVSSDNQKYLKITKKGRNKLNCLKLEGQEALVSFAWDGLWRFIILDLPEERKSEREALRYLLKKANFVCVKNAVWASPHPYEHLFGSIKKDLGLGAEMMIMVTDSVDEDTKKLLFESFGK